MNSPPFTKKRDIHRVGERRVCVCELYKNAGGTKQEDNRKTTQERWVKVEREGGGD